MALDFSTIFKPIINAPVVTITATGTYSLDWAGLLKIETPTGVFYDSITNNPNYLNPDVGKVGAVETLTKNVSLPVDTLGNLLKGNYTITLQTRNKVPHVIVGVSIANKEFEIAGDYSANPPSTFTITGSTGNDGTYTVVSATYGSLKTTYKVSEVIPDATVDGSIQLLEVQTPIVKTFNYEFSIPTVTQTITSDCLASTMTITDTTVKTVANFTLSTVARALTIEYPVKIRNMSTPTNIVITSTSESYSYTVPPKIYTKTWTITQEMTLVYTSTEGYSVSVDIEKEQEYEVTCSNVCMCKINTCISDFEARWEAAKNTNPKVADELQKELTKMIELKSLYYSSMNCNDTQLASDYLADLKALANSHCGCCGDEVDDEYADVVPITKSASDPTCCNNNTVNAGLNISNGGTYCVTQPVQSLLNGNGNTTTGGTGGTGTTSTLAQANQQPQGVLTLLGG